MPGIEAFEVQVGERLPRLSRAGGEVRVTPLMGLVLPRLREVLVGVAARGATISYGELSAALDHAYLQQGLGPVLDVLAVDCARRGEPRLDALVARRSGGEVGPGFDGDAAQGRSACWEHWGA